MFDKIDRISNVCTSLIEKTPYILYGGDYNPEQWTKSIWDQDMELMKKASVNVITIGVFSWATIQPYEHVFKFEWMDEVMDKAYKNGINVILATPTAAQPAWMSAKYPEVLRADDTGTRNRHGKRVNYCPNSSKYRQFAGQIAEKLAGRYADHPALILWHVSNEYAGPCYCNNCANQFREWLKGKYYSLDELNYCWYTTFWGHTYTDWNQIEPPYKNGETWLPALKLDYDRFMSDSILACYNNEADILRKYTPHVPITTNMMGTQVYARLDYRKWAPHIDIISWDSYPIPRQVEIADFAFQHDLNRGLKDGRPYLLMEQAPGRANSGPLKPPGVMRLWSYMAIAHGADSIQYFQWRAGRGGMEKFHGAILGHGEEENTRIFREISHLGTELEGLKDRISGSQIESQVGFVFDWDNWWATCHSIGITDTNQYLQKCYKHYKGLWRHNIPIDVVFADSNWNKYKIIIAPMLYMIKKGFGDKVEEFVNSGGIFVTGCFTGVVNETDLAFTTGYPGPLRKVMGVWIEEFESMHANEYNTIVFDEPFGQCKNDYRCTWLCDLMHVESAEVLARYGDGWYANRPVVTANSYGKGKAYYIGTDPDERFLRDFYKSIIKDAGIRITLETPEGVEAQRRHKEGKEFIFLLNHNDEEVVVDLGNDSYKELLSQKITNGRMDMGKYDVQILEVL